VVQVGAPPDVVFPPPTFVSLLAGLPPAPQQAAAATSAGAASGYLAPQPAPGLRETDRWYFQVFQSASNLIRALLPGGRTTAELGLSPSQVEHWAVVVITSHRGSLRQIRRGQSASDP